MPNAITRRARRRGARIRGVKTTNQWQPIYGDDIGPTTSDRIRSGVGLGVVLSILGVGLAAGLALSVAVLFGLFGAVAG
jgi:hypothetical protein